MSANEPWVLGICHPNHNGAACLLRGSEIVVNVQEERLSRFKRAKIDNHVDSLAARYCLDFAGITLRDLDLVVVCTMDGGGEVIRVPFENPPVVTISHHLGHAVGVFATSGFQEAAILVVDGCGSPIEDLPEELRGEVKRCRYPATCTGEPREVVTIYEAHGTQCVALEKHAGFNMDFSQRRRMPDFGSLGGMFNSVALQIFDNITEAGKVMGLAPYGRPEFSPRDMVVTNQHGCFEFFDTIPKQFVGNERWPRHKEPYENLSFCVQEALEQALAFLMGRTRQLTTSRNLCYAGGVALNGVANEKVVYRGDFEHFYVMPAAEDSGGAIGAAYHGLWTLTERTTRPRLEVDAMGRRYTNPEILTAVESTPAVEVIQTSEGVLDAVVDALDDGAVVGWFQGGSELGPRALGQRSILCDPRRPDAKAHLNARVKHRESFRPFAAVVLLEEAENWFQIEAPQIGSPFMLRVCPFRDGAEPQVPAVSHVDHSGRVQTVSRVTNRVFYDLVSRFGERTGVPMLLNTSFNVMGEPIVESPEDALWCLLYTGGRPVCARGHVGSQMCRLPQCPGPHSRGPAGGAENKGRTRRRSYRSQSKSMGRGGNRVDE